MQTAKDGAKKNATNFWKSIAASLKGKLHIEICFTTNSQYINDTPRQHDAPKQLKTHFFFK